MVTAVLALFLKACVVEAYRIPSGSMENTLLAGDFIIVNKFVYGVSSPHSIVGVNIPFVRLPGLKSPQRGDLVVFAMKESVGTGEYVKRCTAVPGDTLTIVNKAVYVNGTRFVESPLAQIDLRTVVPESLSNENIFPPGAPFNEDNYGPLRIPARGDVVQLHTGNISAWEALIRGEGHSLSVADGRVLIDGAAMAEYTIKRDYYFMMGDNRDNSLDSRFRGFIASEDIIGEALLVYWSIDQATGDVRWSRIGNVVH